MQGVEVRSIGSIQDPAIHGIQDIGYPWVLWSRIGGARSAAGMRLMDGLSLFL